ncbi:hypothetical protein DIE13_20575 [Burkholderia sp. Bp9016]|nr:hypothetical protein DIE13_20575 [Burkholderia sp. Bp9016]
MRHGLPSPWVAGRTAYARWPAAGTPAAEKCRNAGRFGQHVFHAPASAGRTASLCTRRRW